MVLTRSWLALCEFSARLAVGFVQTSDLMPPWPQFACFLAYRQECSEQQEKARRRPPERDDGVSGRARHEFGRLPEARRAFAWVSALFEIP